MNIKVIYKYQYVIVGKLFPNNYINISQQMAMVAK